MAEDRFLVGPEDAGLRLDRYLARRVPPSFSRTVLQRAIELERDRKSTRLNSSHGTLSRMPSSA